jgi:hypothetical protein
LIISFNAIGELAKAFEDVVNVKLSKTPKLLAIIAIERTKKMAMYM